MLIHPLCVVRQLFLNGLIVSSNVAPAQVGMCLATNTLLQLIGYVLFGIILSMLSNLSFGKILLKYPQLFTFGYFSHDGLSLEDLQKCSFSINFFSKDYCNNKDITKNKQLDYKVITRVNGPELGYIATPMVLVASELCVLRGEVNALSGILTTAIYFRDTFLIEFL